MYGVRTKYLSNEPFQTHTYKFSHILIGDGSRKFNPKWLNGSMSLVASQSTVSPQKNLIAFVPSSLGTTSVSKGKKVVYDTFVSSENEIYLLFYLV
jgi:hypothetical protein